MKRTLIGAITGLALGAGAMWMILTHHLPGPAGEAAKDSEHAEHGEARDGNEVKLSREKQTSAGLQVAPPQPAEWKPQIRGYGRVLDPAPLVSVLFDIDTAQAALAASAKEHARVKSLFTQNQNASLQALETAEAAMRRDELLRDSVRTRLLTAWGRNLAGRDDLPALAQSLAALRSALVRIDLTPGQSWIPTPTAQVALLTAEDQPTEAEFIGAAPQVDPQTQGLAFLFLLRTNVPAPGTALAAHLPSSGAPEKGWKIPLSALVRHEGAVWYYAQMDEESFERRIFQLDRRLADGWFVTEGLTATNRLVVTGAQALLSEQLKGAGGEE